MHPVLALSVSVLRRPALSAHDSTALEKGAHRRPGRDPGGSPQIETDRRRGNCCNGDLQSKGVIKMSDNEFPTSNTRGLLGGAAKTAALVGGGGVAGFELASNTTVGVSAA